MEVPSIRIGCSTYTPVVDWEQHKETTTSIGADELLVYLLNKISMPTVEWVSTHHSHAAVAGVIFQRGWGLDGYVVIL